MCVCVCVSAVRFLSNMIQNTCMFDFSAARSWKSSPQCYCKPVPCVYYETRVQIQADSLLDLER